LARRGKDGKRMGRPKTLEKLTRLGKPSAGLLRHKRSFFEENDRLLAKNHRDGELYRSQSRRTECKNCLAELGSGDFVKLQIGYVVCASCGHLNGLHEDSPEFCHALYADDADGGYAATYHASDKDDYFSRMRDIYVPKLEFLEESLTHVGEAPHTLKIADVGAGSGHFVAAMMERGFDTCFGIEVSRTQVALASEMLGPGAVRETALSDLYEVIETVDAEVCTMIGVLEHLTDPRRALEAIRDNQAIRYLFVSLPLFSICVFFEMVFPQVMQRQLTGGHTHLYTPSSIDHFCNEFGLEPVSEWWFGTDITDLYRDVFVALGQSENTRRMQVEWEEHFLGLVDELQLVIDRRKLSSEVHLLLAKKPLE